MDICIRETRKYVGTYQHEDSWRSIGNGDEIGSRQLPRSEKDEEDPCDPISREVFVVVTTHDKAESDTEIMRALRDSYTMSGCHCEHDCCGCRSFFASNVERVTGDLWKVTVNSSRNY